MGVDYANPMYVCESCHLKVRGGIPGVQKVIVKVAQTWGTGDVEIIQFTIHDSADCLSRIGDIITDFVLSADKHKRTEEKWQK